MSESLPRNWETWPLASVGEWTGGGTPASSEPSYWDGDVPWVTPKDMKTRRIVTSQDKITATAIENSAVKMIDAGAVLFVTRSGILAHSFPVATTSVPATVNQDLKAITPVEAIDADYLAWALRAFEQTVLKSCAKHGTTVHSIEMPALKSLDLPIAPLNEQRRIVAQIEELFSELDKGVENLTTAREQLKVYRQSVLKHAFGGRLTADWRARHPDKLESPETLLARIRAERRSKGPELDTRILPELPTGWVWASIQDVGDVQLGRQRAPQHHSGDHLRPYLRVANVLEDALDLGDVKEMNFTPEEYETFALRDGDVLLNEGQTPDLLGRPAIYRDEIPGCCFQKTLLRFRPGPAVNSEFALIVFRHYMRSGRFKKESRITTNIAHLTQVRFVVIEFPLPTRAEQDEIVRRFREREALDLDAEIENALARIAALRQSILQKAFSGQLAPQDASDEPASALLERIRAQQQEGGAKKRRNNKNSTQEAA